MPASAYTPRRPILRHQWVDELDVNPEAFLLFARVEDCSELDIGFLGSVRSSETGISVSRAFSSRSLLARSR